MSKYSVHDGVWSEQVDAASVEEAAHRFIGVDQPPEGWSEAHRVWVDDEEVVVVLDPVTPGSACIPGGCRWRPYSTGPGLVTTERCERCGTGRMTDSAHHDQLTGITYRAVLFVDLDD